MNDPSTNLDAAIDRLVDGEVGPEERRALLALLETTPAGWRKCALSFLEAQAWREAMPATTPSLARPDLAPPRLQLWFRKVAASAAGLLVTFSIGLLVGSAGRAGNVHREAQPSFADSGAQPIVAPPKPSGKDSEVARSDVATVPILDRSEIDERWWDEAPQALPEYVRSNLERNGYRVEQHRSLVAVDLEDGRRVAVPVDQVDLRFTAPEPN